MNNSSLTYNTALNYFQNGNLIEAAQICEQILAKHTENTDVINLLGIINLKIGNSFRAANLFNNLITYKPNDATAHLNLGSALYLQGNLSDALNSYSQAVKCQSNLQNAKDLLQTTRVEIKKLDRLITSLEEKNKAPTIKFSTEEMNTHVPTPLTLNKAVRLYKHFGYLVIEDLFTEQFISNIHDEFKEDYSQYFKDETFDNTLKVGDKRIMLNLKLQSLFNDVDYYANPMIMPLLSRLLGRDFILFSLGAVTSLPGAQKQHTHRDHLPLFEDSKEDYILPSFAITLGIPLIDMNNNNGTTRFYGKTHLHSNELTTDEKLKGINPILKKGSCILFDYRVLHEGTPNKSTNIRPLMYNVYSRAWFRDYQNYKKQKFIEITETEYQKIPVTHRHLFSWTRNT